MAKTAVVNPRRRRRSNKRKRTSHRRRRNNPSSRRYYGAARKRRSNRRKRHTTRRRRNPSVQSVYSSGGYRQSNPDLLDVDHILGIMPAATGGIWGVRWAMKMAGPFEPEEGTNAQGAKVQYAVPGIKHAIAGVLAARIGSGIIAQVLGDASKQPIAEIAALGFVGDLFMRTRVLRDSKWVADNLMLQGIDDADLCLPSDTDASNGNGMSGQLMIGPDGNLYQFGTIATDPAHSPTMNGLQDQSALNGMQESSALNGRMPANGLTSSFGYA